MITRMNLTISIPSEIVLRQEGVIRIVAEGRHGFFGVLPARLDCVASLVPSILVFETEEGGERYVAVDEGILVKVGADVQVSVRNAILAHELGTVGAEISERMLAWSEQDKKVRTSLAKLERDFVRRLMEFGRHG